MSFRLVQYLVYIYGNNFIEDYEKHLENKNYICIPVTKSWINFWKILEGVFGRSHGEIPSKITGRIFEAIAEEGKLDKFQDRITEVIPEGTQEAKSKKNIEYFFEKPFEIYEGISKRIFEG